MANQNKSERVVGIDIGSSMVKLVCVENNKVTAAVSEFLPESIALDDKKITSDAMADFIKEVAKKSNIQSSAACVILPSNQVYVRSVTMPAMTEQQLIYNLPFEFRDYLIEENNKYRFDYMLEKMYYDEENNPAEMKLFTCAALKQTVEDYRTMLKKAGFRLKSLVPEEYAIKIALGNVHSEEAVDETEQPESKVYCVADLGYRTTELFFYENTEYKLKRTVDFGMYDLEKIISERLGVDSLTARAYIGSDKDDILSSEQCRETYSAFAVEVMKVVNYFNYNNREASVNDFFMCGGGSYITYFSEAVQVATNLRVHSASELVSGDASLDDPWKYMQAYNCAIQE